jgi:hypothetical protein
MSKLVLICLKAFILVLLLPNVANMDLLFSIEKVFSKKVNEHSRYVLAGSTILSANPFSSEDTFSILQKDTHIEIIHRRVYKNSFWYEIKSDTGVRGWLYSNTKMKPDIEYSEPKFTLGFIVEENIIFEILISFFVLFVSYFAYSYFAYFSRRFNFSISSPPASSLMKFINLLPQKYRQSFEQEVSDMRLEYYEALSEKKVWRGRCIVIFYYVGLSWSVVMWISDKVKEVVGIIPKQN